MSYHNSEHALARAVMEELDRAGESALHGVIELSCATALLSNGIKSCAVQIECKAGCGYLIQAFGEEADTLQEKALAIQNFLKEADNNGSSKSPSERLMSLFPGLWMND
jgi:hypothetical protein